jgi:hypothetical protein
MIDYLIDVIQKIHQKNKRNKKADSLFLTCTPGTLHASCALKSQRYHKHLM